MEYVDTDAEFETVKTAFWHALAQEKQPRRTLDAARRSIANLETMLAADKTALDKIFAARDVIDRERGVAPDQPAHSISFEDQKDRQNKRQELQDRFDALSHDIQAAQAAMDARKDQLKTARDTLPLLEAPVSDASQFTAQTLNKFLTCFDVLEKEAMVSLQLSPKQPPDAAPLDRAAARIIGTVQFDVDKDTDQSVQKAQEFKLCSKEFEYRVNNLLDHLTDRRIAEEMDTSSYLFRLNAFFSQARDRAKTIKEQVLEQIKNNIGHARAKANALNDAIQQEVQNAVKDGGLADTQRIEALADKRTRALCDSLDQIDLARLAMAKRLEFFQDTICGPSWMDPATTTAARVSKRIEKGSFYVLWPFIMALAAVIMFRTILSLSASPALIENGHLLSGTVFLAVFLVSNWAGKAHRSRTMKALHDTFHQAITALFGGKPKDQRFEMKGVSIAAPDRPKTHSAPHADDITWRSSVPMWLINGSAVVAPALLLVAFLSEVSLDPVKVTPLAGFNRTSHFASQSPEGHTCHLAKGVLIHADASNYYVLADGSPMLSPARLIFPVSRAQTIAKETVVLVGQGDEIAGFSTCQSPPETPVVTQTVTVQPTGCTDPETCGTTAQVDALVNIADAIRDRPTPLPPDDLVAAITDLHASQDEGFAQVLARPQPAGDFAYTLVSSPTATDPGTPVDPAVFVYSLTLGEDIVIQDQPDTLLMFFDTDISDIGDDVDKAYRRGLHSFDPGVATAYEGAGHYYLQRLSQALLLRISGSETAFAISVTGLASDKWAVGNNKDRLNLALADGRRDSVIAALQSTLKLDTETHIQLVNPMTDVCQPLMDWSPADNWVSDGPFQFEDYDRMGKLRAEILADLNVTDASLFNNQFERSAVVRLHAASQVCGGL